MKQDIIYFIGFGFFNYHYPEEPKGFLPGLKIGYTSNLEQRKLNYQNNLLDYEFLSSRLGDEVLEQAIHMWYSDYRLRVRRLTEWFRDYDYIRETFDIIPDDVFLRYSENLYNPRELNNLYNFGLKYLLKFPEDPFQQDQLWRLAVGSDINLNLNSISDITTELITKIYEFSEKFLNMDLVKLDEVLSRLEEIRKDFKIKTEIDEKSFLSAKEIIDISKFESKMKKCCEYYSISPIHPVFNYLPTEFKEYLDILGPSGLSKVSWQESKIKEAISRISSEVKQELLDSDSETNKNYIYNLIKDELTNYIVIGKKYSKREIKEIFKQIKEKKGLPIVPKSVLINDFYNTSPSKVTDPETNKYAIGYKILSFLQ